jgi:hypothetical protein
VELTALHSTSSRKIIRIWNLLKIPSHNFLLIRNKWWRAFIKPELRRRNTVDWCLQYVKAYVTHQSLEILAHQMNGVTNRLSTLCLHSIISRYLFNWQIYNSAYGCNIDFCCGKEKLLQKRPRNSEYNHSVLLEQTMHIRKNSVPLKGRIFLS